MFGRILGMMCISAFLVACSATPAASVATPSVPTIPQPTDTTVSQAATATPVVTDVATVVSATETPTQFVVPTSTPSNADAPDATAFAATTIAQMPATATPMRRDGRHRPKVMRLWSVCLKGVKRFCDD
jgi:hypothetical protein